MEFGYLKLAKGVCLSGMFCSFVTGLLADVNVAAFSGEFNALSRFTGIPVRLYLAGDETVSGDGRSWSSAYNSWDSAMQEASRLVSTGYNVELWMQYGEYLIAPFAFPSNLDVYGGFDGTEEILSDRNVYVTTAINSTVIRPVQSDVDLLTLSGVSNVVLNSLVIGGVTNATAVSLSDCDETVVFQHCLIAGNASQSGGAAMRLTDASPVLEFCHLEENRVMGVDASGGAVQIFGTSAPLFSACTFNRNISENGKGGGIAFSGSSTHPFVMKDCHLVANSAALGASSLYVKEASGMVTMDNCVVALGRVTEAVDANFAGGIHLEGSDTVPARLEIRGQKSMFTDQWRLNSTSEYEFAPSITGTNETITKVNTHLEFDHLSRLVLDPDGTPDVFEDDGYFDSRPDKKEFRRVLVNPPMLSELPSPGKKVRVQLDEYSGTAVYHSLYLPPDWKPGKRCPVIMDIPGNPFYHQWGDYSTGNPESSPIGYGISEGNAICVGLPCIDTAGASHVTALGDVPRTVDYMKQVALSVCEEWGGDPARMILTGYSRGAIGTAFLGRYDDEIADIWLGWLHYDGYDYPYEPDIHMRKHSYNVEPDDWDIEGGITRRFSRIKGRSTCIVGSGYSNAFESYNTSHDYPYSWFLASGRNHNPIWAIAETAAGAKAKEWVRDTLQNLPGTGSVSGTITDRGGRPVKDARVQTGLTRFAYSDAQGFFTLEGLPIGDRTIFVIADGHTFSSARVSVEPGNDVTHNWQAQ